eukprot:jgi/Chlat1/1781/Chrsp134S02116
MASKHCFTDIAAGEAHHSPAEIRHGACIVKGGKVLAVGHNRPGHVAAAGLAVPMLYFESGCIGSSVYGGALSNEKKKNNAHNCNNNDKTISNKGVLLQPQSRLNHTACKSTTSTKDYENHKPSWTTKQGAPWGADLYVVRLGRDGGLLGSVISMCAELSSGVKRLLQSPCGKDALPSSIL